MFKDVFIFLYAFCLCPLPVMWCLSVTEGCAVASHVATGGVALWANWTTCAKGKTRQYAEEQARGTLEYQKGKGAWKGAKGPMSYGRGEGSNRDLAISLSEDGNPWRLRRKTDKFQTCPQDHSGDQMEKSGVGSQSGAYAVPEKQWHLSSTIVVAEQEEGVSFCIDVFIL